MKHTIKLLTLAFMLAAILTLTGCPGPVNNYYIEPIVVPEYTITVNVTNGTAEYPATAKAGDNVTITATAEEGFTFDGASSAFNIPDCSLSSDRKVITWNFSMFTEDVVINVTFKHEHDWVLESDTATCTEDGVKTYKCSRCDDTREEDSPAHHTFIAGGCDDPNCTEHYRYNDYKIKLNIYSSSDEDGVLIKTLYFSFRNDSLGNYEEIDIDEYGVWVNLSGIIQLKPNYFNCEIIWYQTVSDDGRHEGWREGTPDWVLLGLDEVEVDIVIK